MAELVYKVAIAGDVHWSQYSSILRKRGEKYSMRLEKLIESMNWFEQFSQEHGCNCEIFLGDTFDRPDLNCEEITALQDVKWNNTPKRFIVGNHESNVLNLQFSSTKIFEQSHITVIDNVMQEQISDKVDFYFIPYVTTASTVDLSDIVKNDDKKKVVFAHVDIAGIQYGKFTSQTGFDLESILNNCDIFIDGHLHNGMIINDKIVLAGNLTGQNFNEDAFTYDHLVYLLSIYDDGRMVLEAYDNQCAMNFYKIRINTKQDCKVFKTLKPNAVVSISCNYELLDHVSKLIAKQENIIESRLTATYDTYSSDSTGSDELFKTDDFVKQFVEFIQTKIEPSAALDDELARLEKH